MRTSEFQHRVVDVRGLCSPQPVLVLADESERVAPGETIEILSDDPCSPTDFLDWCSSAGMDVVELECLAGGLDRFVFRRHPLTVDQHARPRPQATPEQTHAA